MMEILYLDSNKSLREDLSKDEIVQVIHEKKGTLWINLNRPTQEQLMILSEIFNFHPLSIEDCTGYTDTPKIDEFDNHIFIVLHGVMYDAKNTEVLKPELDIFVSKNYVVTVHLEPLKTLEFNLDKVRKNPSILAKGADFLLYHIIDDLVENYRPLLDVWEDRIAELEDKVLDEQIDAMLPGLLQIKREVVDLRRHISPQRDIINKLARRDSTIISNKNVVYFRDIYDHIVRIHELLETNRELLTTTFEAYLSAVSNRMSDIMKRLTIVATIFMPLTLIVGLYGMNFNTQASRWNMPELNWVYGYPFVIGLMIIITISMMIYFKIKKWY